MKPSLWEILVPVCWPDGTRIEKHMHQMWDWKAFGTVGYARFRPSMGNWQHVTEEMIPVRFMATAREAERVAKLTQEYYRQRTVMYYKLSSEVYFT